MKRRLLIALVLFTLIPITWASDTSPDADERALRVNQDLELIEAFVDGGLRLSQEDDPLRRAHTCNALADVLARNIKNASASKETSRVAFLGEFMKSVLKRGVADNLQQAAEEATSKTPRAADITKLAEAVSDAVAPLEKSLKSALDALPDAKGKDVMLPTLEGISRARAEVEAIVPGKGKSIDKGFKGKGKGKKTW